MTTPRSRGAVMLLNRRGPDAATVIPDAGGTLGEIMRVCAARDKLRKEEKRS